MLDILEKTEEIHKYLRQKGNFFCVPYKLDDLVDAFHAKTAVDEIEFIEITAENINGGHPVLAWIDTYDRSPAPYAPPITTAQIHYVSELDVKFKRVIICKELSHLLWHDPRVQVENSGQLLELAEALTLPTASTEMLAGHPQLMSEKMAMLIALDLLCPFSFREALLENYQNGHLSNSEISDDFLIPETYIALLFDRQTHEVFKSLRSAVFG